MVAGQDSFPDPEESKILKDSDDRSVCGIGLMSAVVPQDYAKAPAQVSQVPKFIGTETDLYA